jgi:hypothetical protein
MHEGKAQLICTDLAGIALAGFLEHHGGGALLPPVDGDKTAKRGFDATGRKGNHRSLTKRWRNPVPRAGHLHDGCGTQSSPFHLLEFIGSVGP